VLIFVVKLMQSALISTRPFVSTLPRRSSALSTAPMTFTRTVNPCQVSRLNSHKMYHKQNNFFENGKFFYRKFEKKERQNKVLQIIKAHTNKVSSF
jgi:hypothetical protein